MNIDEYAAIPLAWVGPVRITGNAATAELDIPLATFETPLWPSVGRGARLSRLTEQGIRATVIDDRMSRSVLLEADNADDAYRVTERLRGRFEELRKVVATTSRYADLIDMHHQVAGNLLFLRFEFTTGDAAGHNMTTQASDRLLTWILAEHPGLRYGSVSGNFCADKKTSAVNGILGRGKNVVTEIVVPQREVERRLHTTAARITALNTRKNLLGTVLAGGVRTANAHYANMLLAFYLATGQDAANIVEGSQGITYAEDRDGDLYFSCTVPNLIVGTVGNGKHHPFVNDALLSLGCREARPAGENARRLAAIAAAAVLCGELSLLAAQTIPGELMRAHTRLERPNEPVERDEKP